MEISLPHRPLCTAFGTAEEPVELRSSAKALAITLEKTYALPDVHCCTVAHLPQERLSWCKAHETRRFSQVHALNIICIVAPWLPGL